MADIQAENNVEEQAQQEPMPSSEQKGQDLAESQPAAQVEETVETPAGESEGELSREGVSDRTRQQFEKLRSQLREARERIFKMEGSQQPEEGEIKPLYDPKTGLVDVGALSDLQKRAYAAEKKANILEQRFQDQTRDSEVRELYNSYPELKTPKTKDAQQLFDEAERIWMHSLVYPEKYGGEALSRKQAADFVKKGMTETLQEKAQREESKEQASLGASGKPTQGVQSKIASDEDVEALQKGTRFGDKDAMIARMRLIRQASEAGK